jgi:hypothetical protein
VPFVQETKGKFNKFIIIYFKSLKLMTFFFKKYDKNHSLFLFMNLFFIKIEKEISKPITPKAKTPAIIAPIVNEAKSMVK